MKKSESMEFLYVLGIVFGVFAVSFVLMNIRHFLTGKEFRGSCASNNPDLKNEFGACSVCGRLADEACKMPEVRSEKVSH